MINPQTIYEPLYTNKDKFIILVTGGRASGKSYNIATFIERLSFEKGHVILFSRYTLTSAAISIIPEFTEKIELEGVGQYFYTTSQDIINRVSGSRILFRGIKTSSGNQTAKLKSIQGLTTFICDEAEEWQSEKDFDRIMLSIRQKGIQNRVIIIMNPTDVNHFIYRKFIDKTHKIIEIDGVPVQISTHPNVLHIHTSYLDNLDYLGNEFLKIAAETKEQSPEKYAHQFMGQWSELKEGIIFKFEIVDNIPYWIKKRGIGVDYGYSSDPTAIVECALHENDFYIDEKCYKTKMLTNEIIDELKKVSQYKIISESADPRMIQEIHNAGVNICPVDKYSGSIEAGIAKMLEFNIKVTRESYNAIFELQNYAWDKDKDGIFNNKPIDKFNHIMDAARYWVLENVIGKRKGVKDLTGYF
jgi:phage terminase large subunit